MTRIDFVYRSTPKYVNGGWVQIDQETFIRPVNTAIRLTLVQAVNNPITPKKYWFKKAGQCLFYTLCFPKLPDDVVAIDIIEREAARPYNFFNFYGVSLHPHYLCKSLFNFIRYFFMVKLSNIFIGLFF